MGLVSSICKRKRRVYHDPIVHNNNNNNFTQTTLSKINYSPSISSEKTQCSAISRQPTKNTLFQDPYYFSPSTYSKPIRDYPDFPIFTSPFCLPYNSKDQVMHHSSSPYLPQTNIHRKDPIRTTKVTTVDHHETSFKSNIDDGGRLIKRSTSAPINMFLIDISNEQVLLGQPVSMNIRHLLLDTLENQSTPISIEPSTFTTYAHENLLDYIPYVCARYPNVTVDAEQITRNTLHVRMPT